MRKIHVIAIVAACALLILIALQSYMSNLHEVSGMAYIMNCYSGGAPRIGNYSQHCTAENAISLKFGNHSTNLTAYSFSLSLPAGNYSVSLASRYGNCTTNSSQVINGYLQHLYVSESSAFENASISGEFQVMPDVPSYSLTIVCKIELQMP